MRLVSFLPSATEMLYELGVEDYIMAVTHECNYPAGAKTKPRVIHSSFDPQKMSSQEIDSKVVELANSGKDIYILDEQVLKKANPDLIVAQGICEVCSPYTREISRAMTLLENKPEVLILDPKNLDDILQNIIQVGNKVGKQEKAKELVEKLQKRITRIKNTHIVSKPKVLCIEWLDPLFSAGHWVPQMVEIAGGINGISSTGDKSRRMQIEEITKFDPDIVILMPCGFDVQRTIAEYEKLLENPIWRKIKAVNRGQVYAVNANEYFSKPGPRTVTGVEILAKIIHPDTFRDLQIPKNSIQKIDFE
ncbi:putative ABC uptake transporter, heme-binding protein [Nitrosotalea sinensis]|jgi:iron complex transport system substrate-binding protein|uniref:Putative ABC uptake transporter, heme-binding protein n=1 Tax=Nitrosotalea sinensis TaxID=1499975 RepID=A0A2H1EFP2_9ARCH|nr:cobalamin-binding protein [Candidatus Nitrosotalea sinensis]SHO43425.1 putative ABC uptake transporter, heme-binding protein [Candidatus Nitrosotalea sinensis]